MCSLLESPLTPPNLLLGPQAGSSYWSSLEARNLSLLFSLVPLCKLLFHPGDTIFEVFFPFSFLPQCPCPSSMSSPQGCSTSLLTGDPPHIHSSNSNSLHMGASEPSHAHRYPIHFLCLLQASTQYPTSIYLPPMKCKYCFKNWQYGREQNNVLPSWSY